MGCFRPNSDRRRTVRSRTWHAGKWHKRGRRGQDFEANRSRSAQYDAIGVKTFPIFRSSRLVEAELLIPDKSLILCQPNVSPTSHCPFLSQKEKRAYCKLPFHKSFFCLMAFFNNSVAVAYNKSLLNHTSNVAFQ